MKKYIHKFNLHIKNKTLQKTLNYHLGSIISSVLRISPFDRFMTTAMYNYIYSKKIRNKIKHLSFPSYFEIEPTNICNADCLMCPQGTMSRKKGIMNMESFCKIVDDIGQNIPTVEGINLSGFGEPLLDPMIIEKIKYCKSRINCRINLFTNASLFNEEKIKGILKSGLDVINISFNAGKKRTYKKIMNLDYDVIVRNIESLIETRKSLNVKKPTIIISCVITNYNKDELELVKRKWSNLVDGIAIGIADNWTGDVSSDITQRMHVGIRKWPCRMDRPHINWNGTLTICCRDYDEKLVMGNVMEESILKIWNSRKYQRIRDMHYSGKIDKIPVCRKCDNPIKESSLSWWTA